MAKYVDKDYLQEQFRQFLNYLKSSGVIDVDTSSISSRISSLETQISEIQTNVSSLQNSVSSLDSRVTEVEGRSDIYVGSTAPSDSSKIWIDTSAS